VRHLKLLLHDRRRRQRGSVLSAVLIIVAFLAILIGALLTELTNSFTISQSLLDRVKTEATVTSSAELAIHQLQVESVPAICAQDRRGPWSLTLNGQPATVTQTCSAILPEQSLSLASGFFNVDGVHDTGGNRNRYLVSDTAGRLSSYSFGQTTPRWTIGLGGAPTASALAVTDPNGSVDILAPVAKNSAGCAGHCVVVFNERNGGTPSFRCDLAAGATVGAPPAAEVTAGGSANFPGYVFFGDSGGLYVYDASAGGTCPQQAAAAVGGRVVGAPLVFPGRVANGGRTVNDEVFALVTGSTSSSLNHWRYTETTTPGGGAGGADLVTRTLTPVNSLSLTGANVVGYGVSSNVPASGAPLSLVVATASGRLDLARIAVSSGPSYTTSTGVSVALPNGAATARAPYWCHCPGQDLIGVGGSNGLLYLYNSGLTAVAYTYDGQPDGRPAINTTPMADAAGDWYFGANDGQVYDVEIPMGGTQMFKAAKFGPGGAIASSPIVGACPAGPCLYFASTIAGSYFARIGSSRVSDLRACISSAPSSTSCASNPRLWARVQVGPGAVWGGTGVYVQGWSFYSP
jgi:hypothetical protein